MLQPQRGSVFCHSLLVSVGENLAPRCAARDQKRTRTTTSWTHDWTELPCPTEACGRTSVSNVSSTYRVKGRKNPCQRVTAGHSTEANQIGNQKPPEATRLAGNSR